jgi:5-bromo-4-chloroindolyl phosphate hydrolysis protein
MIFFFRPISNRQSAWLIIIAMLILVPPVGVLLLVRQLLNPEEQESLKRHLHPKSAPKQDERPPLGARTTSGRAPSRDANPALTALLSKGKRLVTLGTILTVLFAISSVGGLAQAAAQLISGNVSQCYQTLVDATPILCFLGAGIGCLLAGLQRKKLVARYRSYLTMVGQRPSIPIQTLAEAAGLPVKQMRREVQDMLDLGVFPTGFLDRRTNTLVLTPGGLTEPAPEKPAQPLSEEEAILQQIRAVKQSIRNPQLSDQVDQVERLTGKLLDYRKKYPENSDQLPSFFNYYLPTTLKLLQAYSQMEQQEVSGENITAAMERIEGIMDKVVEGFETQLDRLFQGDVLDITAEVAVLERMLAKDGLSDDHSLTLER